MIEGFNREINCWAAYCLTEKLSSPAGEINATFCPAVSGCREVVVAEGRIALDFYGNSAQLPSISVIVPHGKTLVLVSAFFFFFFTVTQANLYIQEENKKNINKVCKTCTCKICRFSARVVDLACSGPLSSVLCHISKNNNEGTVFYLATPQSFI